MFKDKDRKEILELFKGYNYQLINFNKNDIIALEYEPCNKIGLIISGTIDIKRMLASNNALHLSSLTSGNLFGEVIAFSDINVYPATVISTTSSEILFINKADFIKFCTDNTNFLNSFLND